MAYTEAQYYAGDPATFTTDGDGHREINCLEDSCEYQWEIPVYETYSGDMVYWTAENVVCPNCGLIQNREGEYEYEDNGWDY